MIKTNFKKKFSKKIILCKLIQLKAKKLIKFQTNNNKNQIFALKIFFNINEIYGILNY